MRMPRCENCKHWKDRLVGAGETRRCARILNFVIDSDTLGPVLYTKAGFGCNQFEAKDD